MLEPNSRLTVFEQLRPPEGYRLDAAVITTYSLDLVALMTVPLAFTYFDGETESGAVNDALPLLEAVRRHADRLMVFCQSGQIAVPSARPLLAYLEDSIFESLALKSRSGVRGAFHPKLWIMRFIDDTGQRAYRLLCMSRNLTFDKSWDVSLCLDGQLPEGRVNGRSVNAPLAQFVDALGALSIRELNSTQASQIEAISREVRRVDWASSVPSPFEKSIRFWPIGLTPRPTHPITGRVDRLLVLAPFVNGCWNAGIAGPTPSSVDLIARPEQIDALPLSTRSHFRRTAVLADDAAQLVAVSAGDGEEAESSSLRGLHAKVWVAESGWSSRVWIGSANATRAAFTTNVEFMCELAGKRSQIGIDQLLRCRGGKDEPPGLGDMLVDYTPSGETASELPPEEVVDRLRHLLSETETRAEVVQHDDGFGVELTAGLTDPRSFEGARVRVWPVTLGDQYAQNLVQDGTVLRATFPRVTLEGVTAFFVFDVSLSGSSGPHCQFVRRAELVNVPSGRREALLRLVLSNPDRVLQYLLFLLASRDDAEHWIASAAVLAEHDAGRVRSGVLGSSALFEAIARALAQDSEQLDEIERVVSDLRDSGAGDLLPVGFDSVWLPALEARKKITEGSA